MVHIEVITDEEAAELYRVQGNEAFQLGNFDEAVYYYTEAMQHQKKNPVLFSNRAAAFLKLDNCLQAEADCSSALQLDPENVKAYNRRGQARQKLGDLQGAAEDFEKASKLSSDSTILDNLNIVRKTLAQKETEKKNTKVTKKAEVAAVNVVQLRQEAKELFQGGQFQEAADKYSMILQVPALSAEDRILFLNNRSACYIQMKMEQEALDDLNLVLETDPHNTKARLRRAILFENLEKHGAAYDDYKFVMQADPTNSAKASEAVRRLALNFPELKQRTLINVPSKP